ncbi:unnamed protein product [Peniophora sp. CBMAI 1063]|nr:unnamed protein product [Peniophora sp. CBMAI 1063]
MPPKRHFDFDSSSDAPEVASSEPGAYPTPAKRRHLTSTPVRSPPRSSDCSLYSEYSTPYTPYAKSVPSDSPTNPFGFVRRHVRLGLPKETSFSRHLALRFQLVSAPDLPPVRRRPREARRLDHRGSPAFWECEGTYRIVQVPLNYSLAHIHALVLFLFNGDPSRAHSPPAPGEQGYLFEAKRDISYYHESWRLATLSGGTTWAKASRVQDPYYSAKSFADLVEASNDANELPFFEEDEDWSWENEDEFGLANIWPPGGDLSKAIVYRHDSQRVVHITVCTQTIPARKGVGNKPYVFRAYEDISLDPTPIEPSSVFPSPPKTQTLLTTRTTARTRAPHTPDPSPPDLTGSPSKKGSRQAKPLTTRNPSSNPFKSSTSKPAASIFPKPKTSKIKSFKPSLPSPSPSPIHDLDDDAEGSDVDEDDEDKFDGGLDPYRWNKHDAFSRFLTRMSGPSPTSPGHASPGAEDSPLRIPSSRPASSLGMPSSPSSSAYASADEGDHDVFRSSSPLRLPVITPMTSHAPTRARIERAERRIREHTASVERTALEEEARREKREKEKAEREKKRRALERIKEEKDKRAKALGKLKGRDEAKKGVVARMRGKTRAAPRSRGGRVEEVRGGDGWDAVPAGAGEVLDDNDEEGEREDEEEHEEEAEEDDQQEDEEGEDDPQDDEGEDEEQQDSEDDEETRAREEAHYQGYRAARRTEVIRLMGGSDGWADIPANAGGAWDEEEGDQEEDENENPFDDGSEESDEDDGFHYKEEPDV